MFIVYTPETVEITVVEVNASLSGEAVQSPSQMKQYEDNSISSEIENEDTCQNPSPENAQTCAAIEEQILATTLRIDLHLWQGEADGESSGNIEGSIKRGTLADGRYTVTHDVGHGTVKDGRYLVTHNHFNIPLDSSEETLAGAQLLISVYKANGEVVLDNVQSSVYTIAAKDSETVVLDFGELGGKGFFSMLGIPSAEFNNWQSLSLAPGMEVAQINWDNETAYVEWVNIKSVTTSDGTPRIELNNGVIKGASGGGIFWNGTHIGNNWTSSTVREVNGGTVVDAFSTAALNSEWING
jgi:hypothetical protein